MSEKDCEFTLEYLKNDISSKFKHKIKSIVFESEYNTLINLLKDLKTMRTFVIREMHGICAVQIMNPKDFIKNKDFFLIFPKKKNENLEINDFLLTNINSNHIYVNNYVYKGKLMFNEEWENYKKVIIRFEIQNKDKQISNQIIKKNSNDNNENININIEESNIIEMIFSFYSNINNFSTVLINEILYNSGENEINRFCDILNIYYEKCKNFINKNLHQYLCCESILINRGMKQIFNYIMSLKLFYNERFELKDIQKFSDEVNIFVDVKTRKNPNISFQCRCHILKLSEISCFVSVIALIDVKHFSFSKDFVLLKSSIITVLKLLKQKIEKELIEN